MSLIGNDTQSSDAGVYPSRFRDLAAARERYGDALVDLMLRAVALSDEPGDRLVGAFRRLPSGVGWRMLDSAMDDRSQPAAGAPEELDELLAPIIDPPDWVDFDLLEAGAVAWWRAGGIPQLLALTAGSLAYGYGTSFARPLVRTGRLTQMAPRRLGETARWVLVATRPGALRPGAAGLHATVRLRLVHALVRAHLRQRGDWDTFNWGEPISVGDTLATGIFGHFIYPLRCLEDLGIRYSPSELDAITHLWSWISFVLGVPEEFLPGSYQEAALWFEGASELERGDIEVSAELIHALLFNSLAFERVLPRRAAAAAHLAAGHTLGAIARRWMSDERADELGLPNTILKHLVPLLRLPVRARELARSARILGPDERQVKIEFAIMNRVMDAAGTRPASIQPEHIERQPALATT